MYNGPFGSSLEVMAGEGRRARGPRLLSTLQLPGWKHCSLQVTDCKVSCLGAWCLMPCTMIMPAERLQKISGFQGGA